MYSQKGDHVITCVTEHKAILDSAKHLGKNGIRVTLLPVGTNGLIDLEELKSAITDKTILISIMTVNNEVGVIQDIQEIGRIAREHDVLFHTDAVQAAGKIPFDVQEMNVDIASLSAHKMYGPKGVGAIYVRRRNPRVLLSPIIDGGGHERGMRSGTLNVPGIVGFGKAAEIAQEELEEESARILRLRERLRSKFEENLDEVFINGDPDRRVPGNLNMSFAYVEGESLLMGLEDIAVSSGSACTSASLEPSYVLKAMGVGEELAHTSIRFGIGRFNTEEEVDYVADKVTRTVQRLRELSPLYEMVKEGIDLSTVNWTAE
jgi:cysteine desulfurase